MRSIFFLIGIFLVPLLVDAQSCKRKYKKFLDNGTELIKCGANFTIEKRSDQRCIIKKYYPETKALVHVATYKDEHFDELDGKFIMAWDDGTIVDSGLIVQNKRDGIWLEDVFEKGEYSMGKKTGIWSRRDKNGRIVETKKYERGVLNGQVIRYDSLGKVLFEEKYKNGELLQTSRDTSKENLEELPRFPGCEGLGLDQNELIKCAERKMLEYVYITVKYPRNALQKGIQGKALVRFDIEQDGRIGEIKVLNGVCREIEREVVRIVKGMPSWIPGKRNGEPVRVSFTLPVTYRLQ